MKYFQIFKKVSTIIAISIVTYVITIISFPIFFPVSNWLYSVMGKYHVLKGVSIYAMFFALDFGRVVSCFLGGVIVGTLIKDKGWLYGLFIAVGVFIIYGLVAIQLADTFIELMKKYAEKGMLLGRIVQGILIFLLSVGSGILGGHIGEKTVKKPHLQRK